MNKKHEAAIEAQQYTPKFIAGVCGNCTHRVGTLTLPSWMQKQPGVWDVEKYGVESNKCGIGGFPVKKLGSCCEYAFAGETPGPNVEDQARGASPGAQSCATQETTK